MSAQPGKAPNRVSERRRRRYPRFRSEFPVTVSLFSGKEHERLNAHCRDLSAGGIGVLIAADLNPGEVASLEFSLPGQPQPWTMRAVLRCRRGYQYGFEFLSLSSQQSQALAEHFPTLERSDFDFETDAPPRKLGTPRTT
jgi:c-di-GMP-binding flagellar brake protein YcgR